MLLGEVIQMLPFRASRRVKPGENPRPPAPQVHGLHDGLASGHFSKLQLDPAFDPPHKRCPVGRVFRDAARDPRMAGLVEILGCALELLL